MAKSFITVTNRIKEIRSSPAYRNWRDKIIERDGGMCVSCKSTDKVEVDHIKPLALYPKLAFDLENGRVLCKKCHIKTDTYGSLSKYKGDSPVHPILAGDLLYRIQSLPSNIIFDGKNVGFCLYYNPSQKKWFAGYKFARVNVVESGESIEEAIDAIFNQLRRSAELSYNSKSFKFNKIIESMSKQAATKELRHQLYFYIESLLERELSEKEKITIHNLFVEAVKKYGQNILSRL